MEIKILRVLVLGVFAFCALSFVDGVEFSERRVGRRVNIPWLGIGRSCTGCPPHFCDDDPAIIHGYCCGCARFYDALPVQCPAIVSCPLNGYGLCQDYEYMMHCCCS